MGGNWHDKAFFGLHFDLHAVPGDQELGAGLSEEHLVHELGKVGLDFVQCDCKGHPGYAGYPTRVGIPAPHIVKDSLRIWRNATRTLGLPLIVHYSGIWDHAALTAHPEWGRDNANGIAQEGWLPHAKGPTGLDVDFVCPLSPYTTEYMAAQMVEILDAYDVDGFWVDGENWASAPCYCARCRSGFTAETGIESAPESEETPGWMEWLSYSRGNFEEHVRRFTDVVHRRKPSCTVCSNWMYTARQPDPIQVPVDYLSGDFDWIWSTRTALLEARFMDGRGLGWDLMAWGFTSYGPMKGWTFKTVPALCQEAGVVLSCGGAFTVYDQPERTGSLIGWHMDELARVASFCRDRQPFCQHTESVPQVAVLHSYRTLHRRNKPLFGLGDTVAPVVGALHVLLDLGLHVDLLQDEDLLDRMDRYPLIVVPDQNGLSDDLRAALAAYLDHGGRLLVTGREATRAFDGLLGVADVAPETGDSVGKPMYLPDGIRTVAAPGDWRSVGIVESVFPQSATVVSALFPRRESRNSEMEAGISATVRRVGGGRIAGIFGDFCATYGVSHYPGLKRTMDAVLSALAPVGLMRLDGSRSVHATLRRRDDETYVHLVNLGTDRPRSPDCAFVEDVPRSGPVEVVLPMVDEPVSIRLEPGARPMTGRHHDGEVRIIIESVGIHDVLVLTSGSTAVRKDDASVGVHSACTEEEHG
jgi:hypothetical protein